MADDSPVKVKDRVRRAAESCVILGLCLMAVTAVAWAEDPTPTPTPPPAVEPVVTAIATETPVPTVAPIVPTPEPTPEPTSEPTVTAAPTVAATAIATGTPTATPTRAPRRPRPPAQVRQAPEATPTPEPTPADPSRFSGATMTICHKGDDADPYVTVVVDAGAPSEHYDPGHELDLIPAPSGGCPAFDDAGFDPDQERLKRVFICHSLGGNTYALVSVERENFEGHEFHRDDLIPAPNRTCPGLDGTATATPEPTTDPDPDPTASPSPEPTAGPTREPRGEDRGEVAGSGGSGGASANAPSATATTGDPLPFTGFDLWLLASAGLGLALAGTGLRLLAQPAVGVTR